MKFSKAVQKARVFDPHETVRAQSLAGVPLAEFWQRSVAFAIDLLIVLAICIPLELAWHYLMLRHAHRPPSVRMKFSLRELEDLAWLVFYSGLSVWWTNGLTVGKRLLRIRVVSLKYQKITLWQAVERALGYGASSLEGGFGFIQFFIHHNRCCVHDRIAETIVVKEPRPVRPITVCNTRAGRSV
jgi:uncharacterized RDD family membrane protein YckC